MTPEKRAAAGIIRRHVWRGRMPPSPDRYPWSMARELHAWQRLVDAGTGPVELNAALGLLRSVYPAARRVTCLLSVPGLLADALQAARVADVPTRPRRGGFRELSAVLSVDSPRPSAVPSAVPSPGFPRGGASPR